MMIEAILMIQGTKVILIYRIKIRANKMMVEKNTKEMVVFNKTSNDSVMGQRKVMTQYHNIRLAKVTLSIKNKAVAQVDLSLKTKKLAGKTKPINVKKPTKDVKSSSKIKTNLSIPTNSSDINLTNTTIYHKIKITFN